LSDVADSNAGHSGAGPYRVLLGMGSNLGCRLSSIARALRLLATDPACRVVAVSPIYSTAPVGGPPQGDFLNGCVLLEVDLTPPELLPRLKAIERSVGRVKGERFGPRVIDLDILLYGDACFDDDAVRVPHPRFTERAFALVPAADLVPHWLVPGSNDSVGAHAARVSVLGARAPEPVAEVFAPWHHPQAVSTRDPLLVVKRKAILRELMEHRRLAGESIGFVPTMGALHVGHASLVQASVAQNDTTVASIFVNPTQFGQNEDLSTYPRTPTEDCDLLWQSGCDVLWMPDVAEMYPAGFRTRIAMDGLPEVLCGRSRPTHFAGVLQVVLKLLHQVGPSHAYFGRKDYQQALVIRQMVKDLDVPVVVVTCPIVREEDGLALSSRNRYLTGEERRVAPLIRRALLVMNAAFRSGVLDVSVLLKAGQAVLSESSLLRLDYLEVRHPETLELRSADVSYGDLIAIAAFLGRARLIDNLLLGENADGLLT
ncbi:MAG TPA: pantoate--beta-alanine ligase, partial [Planctomycetota bacterium]|nr:pantoate--beta-alanine ligase [Planctomycetota bacterium]